MPILEIDGVGKVEVDGSFLKLSAEDRQKTVDEITVQAGKTKRASEGPALAEGIGQGASFGTTDEIEGGLRAAGKVLGGDPRPFGELYEEGVSAPRERYAGYEAEQPGAFYGGQVAGGLAVPFGAAKGATMATRAAKGAATGAAGAAAYGAGTAEGGIVERMKAAGTAAPIGAAISAPLSALARPVVGAANPAVDLAEAAGRQDIPLPTFMASNSPAVQGVGQSMRQVPFVGGTVEGAVEGARTGIQGAVERVSGDIAGTGGVADRSIVGAQARGNLGLAVENIEKRADAAYSTLRGAINSKAPVPLPPSVGQSLQRIQQSRVAAGMSDELGGDLAPVVELASRGSASFDGLQRARTTLGKAIKWDQQNGGFSQGDLKIAYDAISQAMENAVRSTSKNPNVAVGLLQKANKQFADIVDETGQLRHFLANGSDESIVTRMLSYATDKGDLAKLKMLRNNMGYSEWRQVAGFAFDRIGQNSKGEFSPAIFMTNYGKMTEPAKEMLFGARSTATRSAIDDIVQVTKRFNEVEAKRNTSNTGRAVLGGLGLAGVGYSVYDPWNAAQQALQVGAVALPIAAILSKPATAYSMAKWSLAYKNAVQRPSNATLASFRVASRNFATNIAHATGMEDAVTKIAEALTGTVETQAEQPDQNK